MIQAGRPRKPSYATMGEIIAVITTCTCGKQKNRKFLSRAIFECECIGPKSWSQLLKLTRLHRNTLSTACKFLVKKKVLTRTVLKKKGHHVTYSVNNSFWHNYTLRAEIELTVKERRQMLREARKTHRSLRLFAKQYQRMHRYYRKRMKWMKEAIA